MRTSCQGLVDYICSRYRYGAEIGVGHFPDIALACAHRGIQIFASDIKPFTYKGLEVFIDDITKPDLYLYRELDFIYSVRPPLELVPYMARLGKAVSADVLVKPLGSEYPGGKLIREGNTTFFLWNHL
ncbi:MAG: UPF0146 family protein [Deltaproteobacteria bacterium]